MGISVVPATPLLGGVLAIQLLAACLDVPPSSTGIPGPSTVCGEWSEPVVIPELTGTQGKNPSLSDDELLLAYDQVGDLLMMRRNSDDDQFVLAQSALQNINTDALEAGPDLSPDGHLILFQRDNEFCQSVRSTRLEPFGPALCFTGLPDGEWGQPDMDEASGHLLYVDNAGRVMVEAECDGLDCMQLGYVGDTLVGAGNQSSPSVTGGSLEVFYLNQAVGVLAGQRASLDEPFEAFTQPVLDWPDGNVITSVFVSRDGTTMYITAPGEPGAIDFYRASRECDE